jgi:hypothetical protein
VRAEEKPSENLLDDETHDFVHGISWTEASQWNALRAGSHLDQYSKEAPCVGFTRPAAHGCARDFSTEGSRFWLSAASGDIVRTSSSPVKTLIENSCTGSAAAFG